jgi:hypothetical protein
VGKQERFALLAQSCTAFGKCITMRTLRFTDRLSYVCDWAAEWKQSWMKIETSSRYQESFVLGVLHRMDVVLTNSMCLRMAFAYGISMYVACLIGVYESINLSPGAAADELWETCNGHYQSFWKLREHYKTENLKLFQVTQKAHSNVHSCLRAGELNPRVCWCFKYEDYMGILRKLAASCKTAYGVEVSKNIIRKWIVAQEWLLKYSWVMK